MSVRRWKKIVEHTCFVREDLVEQSVTDSYPAHGQNNIQTE